MQSRREFLFQSLAAAGGTILTHSIFASAETKAPVKVLQLSEFSSVICVGYGHRAVRVVPDRVAFDWDYLSCTVEGSDSRKAERILKHWEYAVALVMVYDSCEEILTPVTRMMNHARMNKAKVVAIDISVAGRASDEPKIHPEKSHVIARNANVYMTMQDVLCAPVSSSRDRDNVTQYDSAREALLSILHTIFDPLLNCGQMGFYPEYHATLPGKHQRCQIVSGQGSGANRVRQAINHISKSFSKSSIPISRADNVLIKIYTDSAVTMMECADVVEAIEKQVHEDASIVFQLLIDERDVDAMRVYVSLCEED